MILHWGSWFQVGGLTPACTTSSQRNANPWHSTLHQLVARFNPLHPFNAGSDPRKKGHINLNNCHSKFHALEPAKHSSCNNSSEGSFQPAGLSGSKLQVLRAGRSTGNLQCAGRQLYIRCIAVVGLIVWFGQCRSLSGRFCQSGGGAEGRLAIIGRPRSSTWWRWCPRSPW